MPTGCSLGPCRFRQAISWRFRQRRCSGRKFIPDVEMAHRLAGLGKVGSPGCVMLSPTGSSIRRTMMAVGSPRALYRGFTGEKRRRSQLRKRPAWRSSCQPDPGFPPLPSKVKTTLNATARRGYLREPSSAAPTTTARRCRSPEPHTRTVRISYEGSPKITTVAGYVAGRSGAPAQCRSLKAMSASTATPRRADAHGAAGGEGIAQPAGW